MEGLFDVVKLRNKALGLNSLIDQAVTDLNGEFDVGIGLVDNRIIGVAFYCAGGGYDKKAGRGNSHLSALLYGYDLSSHDGDTDPGSEEGGSGFGTLKECSISAVS